MEPDDAAIPLALCLSEVLWQAINAYAASEETSIARMEAVVAIERTIEKLRAIGCPTCASGPLPA